MIISNTWNRYIGDRIGRLNANIIFTLCVSLSSFLVWTFAYTFPVLVAFAVLFGLFCGSYFAMGKNFKELVMYLSC